MKMNGHSLPLSNPHIATMKEDFLYHFGLGTNTHNLPEMFGDVRYVVLGGTPHRMEVFSHFIMKEINHRLEPGTQLKDISKDSHRYSMFKVGPVLAISHGMGIPSITILLHEVIKLLAHAGVKDPVFFRIGTCGGIGLEGGTVVVTEEVLNGELNPYLEQVVLGKRVRHPTKLDQDLAMDLVELGEGMSGGFAIASGKTLCTNDFYEGQGRLDGAFCDYTADDKAAYLRQLNAAGVKNIEMESEAFAALTHRAGIRAAVICVALLNRLNGDQITATKETMLDWQNRCQRLVAAYIKKHMNIETRSRKTTWNGVARLTSYEDDKKNGSNSD